MKALAGLVILGLGGYLIVSSVGELFRATSGEDLIWYLGWIAIGVMVGLTGLAVGVSAGATSNSYRTQYPQERSFGSAEYHDIEPTNITYPSGERPIRSWEDERDERLQRLGIPIGRHEPGASEQTNPDFTGPGTPGYMVFGGTRPGETPPPITLAEARAAIQAEVPAPARKEAPAPARNKDPYGYGGLLDLPHRENE